MSICISDRRFETFKMLQKLIDIFTLNNGKNLKRIRQELTEICMLTVVHSEQGGGRGRGSTPDARGGRDAVPRVIVSPWDSGQAHFFMIRVCVQFIIITLLIT